MEAVLLATGGLDSTTLAHWLSSKAIGYVPLYIDYGQHCVDTEVERLSRVLPMNAARRLRIVEISGVYSGSSSRLIDEPDLWTDAVSADDLFLPYRNMLILTAGAAFARTIGAQSMYAAFINSNNAKEIDCSVQFFESMRQMLSGYDALTLELPFVSMPKAEVARLGISIGAPIAETFSCQVRSVVPCGACPNCVDRLEALASIVTN